MANPARTPGKYGLKPRDPDRRVPILEHYLRPWEGPVAPKRRHPDAGFYCGNITVTSTIGGGAGGSTVQPLPPAPGNIDRLSAVKDWPLYVNGPDPSNPSYAPDGVGDCFWAGSGHMFTALRVYAGYPEVHFSNAAIIKGYESTGFDPSDPVNTDQGTDPAQGLKFLHDVGLVDVNGDAHTVAGYAFFAEPRNTNLMAQVLSAGGTVGVGFNCTQGYQQAFANGAPCEWEPGDPEVGGHWVILQQRSVGGVGVLHEITWGSKQRVTRRYMWHTITEAAMIISQDYIQANGDTMQGLDLPQLLADMSDVE
jgi:hypothetical protein